MAHKRRKCIPQFGGISAGQINFVGCAVQPESDSFVGVAAIEVIDEQYLNFLCHVQHSIAMPGECARRTSKRLEQGEQDSLSNSLSGEQSDQAIDAKAHSTG